MRFFLISCFCLVIAHNVAGMMQATVRGRTNTMNIRMASSVLNVPTLDQQTLAKSGSWFAVLSKSGHEGVTLPIPIEVAGEKLVAWKSPITSEWSVMRDECPHRFAPLSQGRVDPISGCIECPYHGQQFDVTGACTKIPQSEKTSYPASTAAFALPVHSTGDILWAYVPLPPGQASYYPDIPDQMMPELLDASSFMVRDLPYSFDFFLENFMDPAHIPFAHHSMQGTRDDGSPIPMQLLTSYDDPTKLEVAYQDFVAGKARNGVVSFTAPFYYHFRLEKAEGWSKNLIAVIMPVTPGKCRVFFELPPLRKMKGKLPTWISHLFSNRFLESDIWLHDQERFQRSSVNSFVTKESTDKVTDIGDKYMMTTQSDTGCIAWRKWWKMHMAESPIFGEPQVPVPVYSRDEQVDRYANHAEHCTSCSGAEKKAAMVKKYVPFLAVLLAAIMPNRILKALGVVVAVIVNELAEKIIRAVRGPKGGDVTSAAQLPEKKKKDKKALSTA